MACGHSRTCTESKVEEKDLGAGFHDARFRKYPDSGTWALGAREPTRELPRELEALGAALPLRDPGLVRA